MTRRSRGDIDHFTRADIYSIYAEERQRSSYIAFLILISTLAGMARRSVG
jgi:hypothetical protein